LQGAVDANLPAYSDDLDNLYVPTWGNPWGNTNYPSGETVGPGNYPASAPNIVFTGGTDHDGDENFVDADSTGDPAWYLATYPRYLDSGSFYNPGGYDPTAYPFLYADADTFDSIALGPRTHVIIYQGQNFTGGILIDAHGPAVLENT
jgi:hypothetical protein